MNHCAAKLIEEIVEQCPQMKCMFRNPRLFEHCPYSYESNLLISDHLMERITLIFQMNDLDFTMKHYPGKGWAVGCEFPAGIEGMDFEVLPSGKQCNRLPGHAMLGLLWSMVVQCRWNPIVMERREWCRRSETVRQMRVEP